MPDLPYSQQVAATGVRNTDHTNRAGIGGSVWVPDGSAANVWKRVNNGPDAEWGVDLKLGSSLPPTIRVVGRGPNNTAAGNVMRNRTIAVRDKVHN